MMLVGWPIWKKNTASFRQNSEVCMTSMYLALGSRGEIYPWRTMSFHDISMILFPWCIQVASNCHRPERCFVFLVASSAWKANPIAKPIRKEPQKNWALGENRRNILGLFQACRLWLQSPENRGRNRLNIVCRDKNKMTKPGPFLFLKSFFGAPQRTSKDIDRNIDSCTCPSHKYWYHQWGKLTHGLLSFHRTRQLASPKVAKRVESTALALNLWRSKQHIQQSFRKTHQVQCKIQQKAKVHILSIKWSIRTIFNHSPFGKTWSTFWRWFHITVISIHH